ncbi:MAG: glycosyltransferase family 2 protein, partial [Candidatus Bathyarchaeia archaeon]
VICLQSRLTYYNPKENLLTRWFSLEYSFWYDYYLEGLDQVDGVIPLGGTSNHFRTQQLKELGGWDPYNMTEDADLGVRISRRGKKTAMLNSYTYEEANSRLRSWIRQRSRWNKGYIQTYLVHMRHPRKLLKDLGWKRFLLFQLTFGGNIYLPLINPLLWAVTISTILVPGLFQFLFFHPLNYICAVNLLIGNLVYIGLHMGPFILKKNYTSIPLAIAIPLYWILISVGCWRGALQLISKPFYWEKTEHGISKLHGLPQK